MQEQALQKLIDKRSSLDAAGVVAIVWRYVHDNDYSSGYFGSAESHWGVKYEGSSGGAKRGYGELVSLIKGSSGSSASPTTSSGSFAATFTDVKAERWWVEVSVDANQPLSKVEARVGTGSYVTLTKQWWGDYARSISVPSGASVSFRATSSSGATVTSDGGSSSAPAPTDFEADFDPSGNNWWVQVDVDAPKSIAKVEARVNGGSWKPLSLKSWGDWAASFYAADGARVEFRATASDGASDLSGAYTWPA